MTAMKPLDVVAIGLNVVDVLVALPKNIVHGEKHEVSELLVQGGAPAGTAACGLAALGWRVGFLARFGPDALSRLAHAELVDRGVSDALFLQDSEHQPAVAVVEIDADTGERTVYYNLRKYRSLRASDVPRPAIESARLLLVDGYETQAALAALQVAHSTGCKSVLDVEAGDPKTLREMIALGTDTIMPLTAARALSECRELKPALETLKTWTSGTIIVTDGRRGSWAITSSGILHQPAFAVPAIDTTGCGDSYHAAYACALLDALDLDQRMEFASFVASRVAMVVGGRTGLPTRQSLAADDLSSLSPRVREYIFQARNKSQSS